MKHLILVFVKAKDCINLLETEILGNIWESHLISQLPPNCFHQPTSGLNTTEKDRDVLLFSSAAWISQLGINRLVNFASESVQVTKFLSEQSEPIAILLPGFKSIPDVAALQKVELHSVVEQFHDTETIKSSEIDSNLPPVLVKDRFDIAVIEKRILFDRARMAISAGVRVRDPANIYIRGELIAAAGVDIDVNVIIEGRVVLEAGVKVGPNSVLRDVTIGSNTVIKAYSILEDSTVGSDSFVGPYGRIRPGSKVGNSVQIGNFVEIKNSTVGNRSRINHLTFLGDATLESEVTVGAGTITCNHNGINSSPTIIETGAYLGSGTLLIAPIKVGKNATIAAGSTLTREAPAEKLTLARSRQVTVEGWSRAQKDRKKK